MTDENKLLVDWFLEKVHFVYKAEIEQMPFFFFLDNIMFSS